MPISALGVAASGIFNTRQGKMCDMRDVDYLATF